MAKVTPLPQAGDPCPACGDTLVVARVPSEAEEKAARDKETPISLPADYDTASAEQRAELGALSRCRTCGYKTRTAASDDSGDGGGKRTRKGKAQPAAYGDTGE